MEVLSKRNSSIITDSSTDVFIISYEVFIIYTWIVFSVLCPGLNIFGIVTNIINIICFAKQGFNDAINISLLGLSISDLGSLATMICTSICMTPAFIAADLSFDPVEVIYLSTAITHLTFTRISSCITAMITLERCLCITVPFKVKHLITPTRTAVVTVCVFIIFFCCDTPVYTVNRLGITFSYVRNKTLIGVISTEDKANVEKITFAINNFCIPFATFMIIAVCTLIISVKLHVTTKWRQTTITSSQVDKVSSRSIKTSKMVVMISTLFIVCFIPVSTFMLCLGLFPELSLNGKYIYITLIIAGLGYIMESINSSMNIFIYYQMSSKYRDSFAHIFHLGDNKE